MSKTCPQCGSENTDAARFCSNCATPFPDSEAPVFTRTMETPAKELTRGRVFAGRYEIIEELGRGGMGRVYRVLDKELDEEIALKIINPEIASDKKTVERFKNEIKLARKISHKNVGKMYELLDEKGTKFITMEYVTGGDLKKFIRRSKRLDTGTAIAIAKQVCEGLEEAHGLGIVHRDLKPNNIMIDDHGSARIMDFGIARTIRGKGLTGSGMMIGTPEYMSPEQADADEVDQRSDFYSLGIILYEMTTGKLPFEGDTPLALALKHKGEAAENPRKSNPLIPDRLAGMILKCLEKDKEDRYHDAGEVKSELEKIEQDLPSGDRVEPRSLPIPSGKIAVRFDMRKILIPALILAVLSAIGLALIWKNPLPSLSNRVVVTAFMNQTGDSGLDYLGRQAADFVAQGMKTMGTLDVAPISEFENEGERNIREKHFRKLAKNNRAAVVISGRFFRQGEILTFSADIYNADKQTLSASPEPISGKQAAAPRILEKLRGDLMSVVLGIVDPRMAMWQNVSTYVPPYEALIEFLKGMDVFFRDRPRSIECFDRASGIDPNYPLPLFMAGIAHGNDFPKKAQIIEKISKVPRLSHGERCFYDWLKADQIGDLESKFRAIQQQEALAPGTMVSYQLGLDAVQTNRPHLALEALNRLDRQNIYIRDWSYYWLVYANALHMIGEHRKELEIANEYQTLFPQYWGPLVAKIRAFAALGRIKDVHEVLEESQARTQTNTRFPAYLMGNAYEEFMAHGHIEPASEMLELCVARLRERYEEQKSAKYPFALALLYSSNWKESESLLIELHESNPERAMYLGTLGLLYAKRGDVEEALTISERLKNWDMPYSFGTHLFWRAAVTAALGKKEESVSLLRAAVSSGFAYSRLYCRMELQPLWDHPAFTTLLMPRD